MPKIMILSVEGVDSPFTRLVSVDDKDEFLGTIRMSLVKDILDTCTLKLANEEVILDAISRIKISLTDTGLTEYPETVEEVQAVLNGEVLV